MARVTSELISIENVLYFYLGGVLWVYTDVKFYLTEDSWTYYISMVDFNLKTLNERFSYRCCSVVDEEQEDSK